MDDAMRRSRRYFHVGWLGGTLALLGYAGSMLASCEGAASIAHVALLPAVVGSLLLVLACRRGVREFSDSLPRVTIVIHETGAVHLEK